MHPSSSPSQIVIGIFGIAELMMGLHLSSETLATSCGIYIPYWQGLLVGPW